MRIKLRIAKHVSGKFCVQERRFFVWSTILLGDHYLTIKDERQVEAVLFDTEQEARDWALSVFHGYGVIEL